MKRPTRSVAARERESVVIQVVSPVQNDVVLGAEQHAAAVTFGCGGAGVAGVAELLFDWTVLEEGEA